MSDCLIPAISKINAVIRSAFLVLVLLTTLPSHVQTPLGFVILSVRIMHHSHCISLYYTHIHNHMHSI